MLDERDHRLALRHIISPGPVPPVRLSSACFKIGSFTALVGISIGICMGISQNHSLAPVHVHLNLIGWVGMFLFRLFYKPHQSAVLFAAVLQVAFSVVGYVTMLSGLAAFLLTGNQAFQPLAVIGALLVWVGVAMFFIIVARALWCKHRSNAFPEFSA